MPAILTHASTCDDPPVTIHAAGGEERQPVAPEDLGRFAEILEVALSSSGRMVAAAVRVPDLERNRYRRDVVVGPVDADDPPTPVDAAGSSRLPRWSPTGDRLAF